MFVEPAWPSTHPQKQNSCCCCLAINPNYCTAEAYTKYQHSMLQ